MCKTFKVDIELCDYIKNYHPEDDFVLSFTFPNKNVVQLCNHPMGENCMVLKLWRYDENAPAKIGPPPFSTVEVYNSEEMNAYLKTIRDL